MCTFQQFLTLFHKTFYAILGSHLKSHPIYITRIQKKNEKNPNNLYP